MLQQFSGLPVELKTLSKGLKAYISEQLRWCEDLDFSANFPYLERGLPQSFFQQKVITCNGNEYLTGPRYAGGDINKPFIDLVASSAPLTRRAAKAIMAVWHPLGAHSIRVLRIPNTENAGKIDQCFYAGVSANVNNDINFRQSTVFLEKATSKQLNWCMETATRSYSDTYLHLPSLKDKVLPVEADDLSDDIAEGNVYIIMLGDTRVGFIICEYGCRAFISGHWITEEVVLPQFKGQRIAAMAQNELYRIMDTTQAQPITLWGTIEKSNFPSIRAAENAGRKNVMEYVFMKEGDLHD